MGAWGLYALLGGSGVRWYRSWFRDLGLGQLIDVFMTVSFFPGFLLLIFYLYLTTWLINCEMKSTNE